MNRTRKPKPIDQLIKKNGALSDLPLFTKLDSLLQSFLKQHNITGCRLGNLQNGSLLIEIPNANSMMRLQFMRNELLTILRQASPGLTKINIKINPRLSASKRKAKKVKAFPENRATKMSADVAESFLALANESDPELKKAFQSLAQFSHLPPTKT